MKKIVLLSAFLLTVIFGFGQYATNAYHGRPPQGGPRGHHGNNLGPPAPSINVMDRQDFERAYSAMADTHFDSDRLRIGGQILRGNLVKSDQVRSLMSLFTFDRDRLEFAKLAYPNVVDQGNFFVVNDAFTFSSSIRDLDAFIASQPLVNSQVYTYSNGGMNGGMSCGGNTGFNSGYNGGGNFQGSGNGISYSGQVHTAPVLPMCGMCHGHHEMMHICDVELNSIMNAIDKQCFERDKLMVAKQAVRNKMLAAHHVKLIMEQFTFEGTKLEFAKFAYQICYDPFNYYVVNDAFTFSSSIRELDNYIRRV